jgi:hypothetical protein
MSNGKGKRKKLVKKAQYQKGKVERKELKETLQKQWVYVAVELMKEGRSVIYIKNHIAENKKGSTSISSLDKIIEHANALIRSEFSSKAKDIQVLHTRRYNENINNLLKIEELNQDDIDSDKEGEITYEAWLNSRNKKIKAYDECIKSMMQKENLLQMNSDSFVFEINEEVNVEVKETKPKYDFSKLTLEEQVELYELVKLARVGDNEMHSIIERKRDEVVETIDVVAEVVQTTNIDQIEQKHTSPEVPKLPFVVDPTAKLKEMLKREAAKKLQEIGSHLDEKEKFYLNDKDKNEKT